MKTFAVATRYLSAVALGFGLAAGVAADRVDHFKGKSAGSLSEAVENFSAYNHRLIALLGQDPSDARLVEIHELTYTLENALEKINAELVVLADTLEEVHVASETFDRESLADAGQRYTRVIEILRRLGD